PKQRSVRAREERLSSSRRPRSTGCGSWWQPAGSFLRSRRTSGRSRAPAWCSDPSGPDRSPPPRRCPAWVRELLLVGLFQLLHLRRNDLCDRPAAPTVSEEPADEMTTNQYRAAL